MEDGRITFSITCRSFAMKERAVSISRRSTCATPASVLITMMRNEPRKTSATFESTPMPSKIMSSGKNATCGEALSAVVKGSSVERMVTERPIARPIGTPISTERPKPSAAMLALAKTWGQTLPSAIIEASFSRINDGLEAKSGSSQPASEEPSQAPRKAMIAPQRRQLTRPRRSHQRAKALRGGLGAVSIGALSIGVGAARSLISRVRLPSLLRQRGVRLFGEAEIEDGAGRRHLVFRHVEHRAAQRDLVLLHVVRDGAVARHQGPEDVVFAGDLLGLRFHVIGKA